MKQQIQFIIILLFCSSAFGQKIQVISQGNEPDSSYYNILKISNNEFWIGGEYGILKKIDSIGNVSSLNFPNEGQSIIKFVKVDNNVFIITNDAIIYRYDIQNKVFTKKTFSSFKNKCFYDLIILKNGKLLVCGGATGISKGDKKIPKGFIALIDQDLKEINIVWKNYRKFVWSLLELENGDVLASTFNGLNTKIIKSKNCIDWKSESKIKGLVYAMSFLNNNILFSGTRSLNYYKNGFIEIKDQRPTLLSNTGCLWSMDTISGNVIAVSTNGELLMLDKNLSEIKKIKLPCSYSLYDIEKISDSKILIVGHAKNIHIVDFKD